MYYGYVLNGEDKVYICATTPLLKGIELTKEEYLAAITPSEEEIKAEKEAQLRALMNELYPVED